MGFQETWPLGSGFENVQLGQAINIRTDVPVFYMPDTSASAATSQRCCVVYCGRAPKDITTIDVTIFVTVAAATVTWAEFAAFTGAYEGPSAAAGGTPNLTTKGFVSIASEIAAAAVNDALKKTITLTTTPIKAGEEFWVGFSINATSMPTLRAINASDLTSRQALRAATRPSTMAAGSAFTGGSLAVPIGQFVIEALL